MPNTQKYAKRSKVWKHVGGGNQESLKNEQVDVLPLKTRYYTKPFLFWLSITYVYMILCVRACVRSMYVHIVICILVNYFL